MNTLLLTGGTGFFGKSILDAFRRGLLAHFELERVVVVARSARRLAVEAPALCGARVELVDADILHLDSTFDADLVIHAAASSDAQRYRVDPRGEARIIEDGTRTLCELIAESGRRPAFVYISSGAVYGPQPESVPALGEDSPLAPLLDSEKAAYARSKREAERLVSVFAASTGIRARIARCFAFIGPFLPRTTHFAIGNFLENALKGESISVRATHPVIRSYLHADDLADWLLQLAVAPGDGCHVYNVGSDEAVSIQDLAAMVADMTGATVSLPKALKGAPPDSGVRVDRYVPDISKARRELGLRVTIPLKDAIQRTLERLSRETGSTLLPEC